MYRKQVREFWKVEIIGYIQKSRLFEFHILEQSKKVDFPGSEKVDFLFLAKSKKVDFRYPKK